jgi:cell division septal protein FtsQ
MGSRGRRRPGRARAAGGAWALKALRWAARHPQPVIALALCAAGAWGLWRHAQRTDAFRIQAVALPPNSTLRVPETLIGKNLWAVDIQALAESLSSQQPALKRVRVVRRLPNELRVEVIPRRPVAQVRLDRWHPVDGEGFIIAQPQRQAVEELPRLVGFEQAQPPLRAGALNTDERLRLALRLRARLARDPALASRRLIEINVSQPAHIRFLLDGGMEVRCGTEAELTDQLRRLRAAMKVIAAQSVPVRYIDVRFAEPVVGQPT